MGDHRHVRGLLTGTRAAAAALLDFAVPDGCLHCGAALQRPARALCPSCRRSVRCAPAAVALPPAGPPDQRPGRPPWALSATVFRGVVRTLVHALKFEARTDVAAILARPLASLLIDALPHSELERLLLVPVPVHAARRRERGYDQTILLGSALADMLGCEVDAGLLCRVRPTTPQTGLGSRERRRNVEGCFRCRARPDPERSLVLIDDVITTGATLSSAADALRRGGVEVRLAAAVAGTRERP